MKKYGLWVIAILLLFGIADAYAAGLSTKIDHSKGLQTMQDNEYKNLQHLRTRYHERINWDNELKLDDTQKIYLKNIMTDSRSKIDEQVKIIKEAHKAIDKIYEEDNEKLRKVLTPQQQIKFDKVLERWKKAHGQKNKGKKVSQKRMKQY